MHPEEIAGIAFCVSNHIEFYGLTTASDALLFCNRDPVLLTRMIRLFEYDVDGSIMDCGIPSYESNRKLIADCHELLRTAETPRQEELPGKRIHLLCGLPRGEKKAFAGKIPDSYTVSLHSLCGIKEESQLPELEDQPEIRQQAIRELQLESVHSVLLLSGYFLTRHSRRHMLSLLRDAFPSVPGKPGRHGLPLPASSFGALRDRVFRHFHTGYRIKEAVQRRAGPQKQMRWEV